jgi:alkylation response protein AidB-like acyl-CoA dehydrogenase
MRLIGLAERTLERMCRRADQRSPFGTALADQSVTLERIAEARLAIEQCRLLTLKAAHMMDTVGNKAARAEIAMIKIAAPAMAQKVVDNAMQLFGGGGTANDHLLSAAFATARLLRLADGPDEVHRNQLARFELKRHRNTDPRETGGDAHVLSLEEVKQRFAHLRPGAPGYPWA